MEPKNKILLIFMIIIIFIVILITAFKTGQYNGYVKGITVILERNGETMCSFMQETNKDVYEENGICIVSDNATYNHMVNCPFGIFIARGGIEPNWEKKIMLDMGISMYAPIFGCW